ncbi:MAG: acyl-CoA dehydrogenase domain-containing protein [Alphaproteobacteria bacterium]
MDGGEAREHLTPDIYIPASQEQGLGELEATLAKVVTAQPLRERVKDAVRSGEIDGDGEATQIEAVMTSGLLSEVEANVIADATSARLETIQVDVFEPDDYGTLRG